MDPLNIFLKKDYRLGNPVISKDLALIIRRPCSPHDQISHRTIERPQYNGQEARAEVVRRYCKVRYNGQEARAEVVRRYCKVRYNGQEARAEVVRRY